MVVGPDDYEARLARAIAASSELQQAHAKPLPPCGRAALAYAARGWPVIQLGPRKIPRGSCEKCKPADGPRCTGPSQCGHDQCHGSSDATVDPTRISRWWERRPDGGVAIVVPQGMIVLDSDPRHGIPGQFVLASLASKHGPLPATAMSVSGRGDGGVHMYFSVPPDIARSVAVFGNTGLDIKTPGGYAVEAPTAHPSTGQPYAWMHPTQPIAPAPAWLVGLLRKTQVELTPSRRRFADQQQDGADPFATSSGSGLVAAYNQSASFADLLDGWRLTSGDGETEGSSWAHPTATQDTSATIRGGRLYVYSPNTPFDQTTSGEPRGYDRFDTYALLRHGGDKDAAIACIKEGRA